MDMREESHNKQAKYEVCQMELWSEGKLKRERLAEGGVGRGDRWAAKVSRALREGLAEKMLSEQRPERGEEGTT